MTYEVRLAPQAVRDLRPLYEEKEVETSHHMAIWFVGLETAVFSLESIPQRGVATPEDRSLHHLFYGKKPYIYRIVHSIDEQLRRVSLFQIRHGARQPLQKGSNSQKCKTPLTF